MTLTERAKTILMLSKSLDEAVSANDKAKGTSSFHPAVGYVSNDVYITNYESRESITNRIKLLRAELLRLSQEL